MSAAKGAANGAHDEYLLMDECGPRGGDILGYFSQERQARREGLRMLWKGETAPPLTIKRLEDGLHGEEYYEFPGCKVELPPDPDFMNDERATWAETAINAFRAETGTDDCDALVDLLTNLRHYADRTGQDWAKALEMSAGQYTEETDA